MWDLSPYLPLFLIWATVFGPLTGWLAGRRQRQRLVWFAYGALLGPVALLIVVLAPPGQCPVCEAPVRGWTYDCASCGRSLRRPAIVVADEEPDVVAAGPLPALPRAGSLAPLAGPLAASPLSPSANDGRARVAGAAGGPPTAAPGQAALLAVGYFVGGSEPLIVGARYAIVRRQDVLQLQGPVDVGPGTILLEHPIEMLVVSAIGDRLVISGISARRRQFVAAFQIVSGLGGEELERALDVYSAPPTVPGIRP